LISARIFAACLVSSGDGRTGVNTCFVAHKAFAATFDVEPGTSISTRSYWSSTYLLKKSSRNE